MYISEIFSSIQGEGSLAGVPSVFLVAGEAPKATWCETPSAIFAPPPNAGLGTLLANARGRWIPHAVIVGVEPMEMPGIEELSDGLRGCGLHLTIEVSGAVFVPVPCDLISVNVRLRNPAKRRKKSAVQAPAYSFDALGQIVSQGGYQLKFELSDRAETEEMVAVVKETGAHPGKVILQPSEANAKEMKQRMTWMLECARFFGYRLVPRLPQPLPAPPPPPPPPPKPFGFR